jgi:hypothetical protein
MILVATVIPAADFLLLVLIVLADYLAPSCLPHDPDRVWVRRWIVFHLFCLAWAWLLVLIYWVFLFNLSGMPYHRKVLWALGLFWVSGLAMPVFWYLHMWRSVRSNRTSTPIPAEA